MDLDEELDEGIALNSGIQASGHPAGRFNEGPGDVTKLLRYPCEFCNANVISIEMLRKHYKEEHVHVGKSTEPHSMAAWLKKKHSCPHCDYKSNLIGHVKRHILIHTGETPFECNHCEYKCRDKTVLRRHVDRHMKNNKMKNSTTEDEKYQCENCDFMTGFKGALSRHLLRHEDPKICPHCGAQFWKDGSYRNHILLHAGVALYPCKSCDYKTNVVSHLTNHVKRMHAQRKLWACSECNYATSCSSDLSKHKTVHRNDRPYKCDQCEYSGKRRSHLTSHLATHNRVLGNYSCPFCDYTTMLIGALKIHVRSHTGEKPYKCNLCGAAFSSSGGVKSHAYIHIENWSQSCSECDFEANKPHIFRKHMKIHLKQPSTVSIKSQNSRSLSFPRSNPQRKSKEHITLKPNSKCTLNDESVLPTKEKVYKTKPSAALRNNKTKFSNDYSGNPDNFLIKSEQECLLTTCSDFVVPVKTEEIDISDPIKQECTMELVS